MKKVGLVTFAALLLCAGGFAQGPPPGGPRHGGFGAGFVPGMHHGKVVAGAPYSATVTNTSVQTLSDGNTLQHSTTGTVARDSQGRTYEQVTFNGTRFGQNGPTTLVFISDPVAGYTYSLNPTTLVATRHVLRTPSTSGAHMRPAPSQSEQESANRVESDLGTQVVNGVNATGKSITHTLPAGAMGNAAPIVTTSESWTSPDLQIAVKATRTDPRYGQSTYMLTNIVRAEPAASMFQVPSNYTIKDGSQQQLPTLQQ